MTLIQLHDDDVFIPKDRMANLQDLCEKLTKLEGFYGKSFIVTSGYRSIRRHRAIYKKLNDAKVLEGKEPIPIPMKSSHLIGKAADIYDPDPMKDLRIWVNCHLEIVASCGFWMEKFDKQPRIHFQTVPYGSYKPGDSLFFNP